MDTTSKPRRSSTTRKYKAACDQCHNSKVKCSGGDPPCKRCADARLHCHYSLAARIGKPPGSKNRKTLERLNNAATSQSKTESTATNDRIPTDKCSIGKSNGPSKDREVDWHGSEPLSLFHMPQVPDAQSLSPSDDCFDFLNSLQSSDPMAQEFQRMNPTIQFEKDGEYAICSTALSISDVGSPGEAGSLMSWTDSMDSCPSVCVNICGVAAMLNRTGSYVQRILWHKLFQTQLELVSLMRYLLEKEDTVRADRSVITAGPGSNTLQPDAAAALENVAARLTAAPDSRSSLLPEDAHSQPLPCSCLQKYAHVLCQLQTIEKRQCPVQADTLLTCIKLALGTTEDHPQCKHCCFDSRVFVQIIMIFQTIFTWAQNQFRSSADFLTEPAMSLGRHELTQDEMNFMKGALVARALKGIVSALKGIASRNEYAASRIQKRRSSSSSSDGEEYEDLQRLINSLTRRYHCLIQKMIIMTNGELDHWRSVDGAELS